MSGYYSSVTDLEVSGLDRIGEFAIHVPDKSMDLKDLIARPRTSFITSPNGKFHIFYDEILGHFIIVNAHGEVVNNIGEKGEGPSEFVRVTSFNIDDRNRLIVFDGGQMMFKVVDLDSGHISDISYQLSDYSIVNREIILKDSPIYTGIFENRHL